MYKIFNPYGQPTGTWFPAHVGDAFMIAFTARLAKGHYYEYVPNPPSVSQEKDWGCVCDRETEYSSL